MRRFLSTLIVMVALMGAAGAAPAAYAQATADPGLDGYATDESGNAYTQAQIDATNAAGQAGVAQTVQQMTNPSDAKKSIDPNASKDAGSQYGSVMTWIMTLFAWLVGVAALLLDNAVYFTVVKMGDYIRNLSAVGVTWRILRDIGNIFLIFGFIFGGIATILNMDIYGWGKKMLPMLIVGAVFINFSLFFAEAVIDVGNLFATQFYTQINGGRASSPQSFGSGFGVRLQNEGISNVLMAKLGLQTIYGDAAKNTKLFKADNTWVIGFMGILLFIVTAFVLFSLSFVLIARFVMLLFIIIFSPIGIVGLAVPKLGKLAKQWWDTLFEQTVTAPLLLLCLYIALAVISDASFLSSDTSAVGWVNGDFQGFASFILSFLIAMGLLLAVVLIAKKLSAAGADWASRTAGTLTFSATALGLRYTAGKGSDALARKVRESKTLNSTALGRFASRKVAGAFDYGATANYHIGAAANKIPALSGIDYGKTHEGGYRAEKKITEEYKKSAEDAQKEAAKKERAAEVKRAMESADAELDAGTITHDEYDARISPHLAKMSAKEIEDLDGIKKGTEELVRNLSPQQFEALMKSDNLSQSQKDGIKEARFRDVTAKIAAATAPGAAPAVIADAQAAVVKLSNKELAHLDSNTLTKDFVADNLTNDQYEYIGKEGILSGAQKTALDARRKNRFDPAITPHSDVANAIRSLKWNRDQIRKLPSATVTNTDVLNDLGSEALNLIDIVRTGNLSPTDRRRLGTYFEDIATHPTDPRQADFAAYLAADPRIKRDLLIT